MSKTLEDRLGNLIHEIKEIKNDLIFQKIKKTGVAKDRIAKWKRLGKKVSSRWDNVTAAEETSNQREKTW